MLERTNDSQLQALGIDSKYVFLYQRWKELLHKQTRDMHQYRIHNSLTLLDEMISVVNARLEEVYLTDHNICSCLEELIQLIKDDIILSKYYPVVNNYLKKKLEKLSKKDKFSISEKKDLKNTCEYILLELKKSYFNNALKELKNAINQNDLHAVEAYSYIAISHCIFGGWSPQELGNVVRVFMGNKNPEEKWNEFEAILSKVNTDHIILISIALKPGTSWLTEQDALASIGINVCQPQELIEEYKSHCDLSRTLNNTKKYAKVEVVAPDVISAAHFGIKSIAEKMDTASFFNIIKPWDIDVVTIVVINKSNWFVKPLTGMSIYQTYDYIDSSNDIFLNTKGLFSNSDKQQIAKRLSTTFTYANISRASFFQEAKFLNMWVALEALARSDIHDSIIDSVKETVSSSICLRYYYRLFRNFYEDCNRCKVKFDFSSVNFDFTQYTGNEIAKKIIVILKDPGLTNELEAKCGVNSLLLYRYKELNLLVRDVDKVYIKITNHNSRIKWQIQRLYRIRNEIAHSALQTTSSLVIYIEHLYDYLACFITEIVMCNNIDELSSMNHIYSVINDNYNYYIKECSNRRVTNDRIDSFYATGTMRFLP